MNEPTDGLYLSATEAARFLGVRPQTLYAYVSRGLLRSETEPGARGRRYRRVDLEALKGRKRVRRDPEGALAGALDWGMPLLETELTLIAGQRLFYRGRDALELASTEDFWEVVHHFWGLRPGSEVHLQEKLSPAPALPGPHGDDPFLRLQLSLLQRARSDPAGRVWSLPGVAQRGAWAMHHYLATLLDRKVKLWDHAAESLADAWNAGGKHGGKAAARVLQAALVLSVDHELNASSFAARVAASAGASLYESLVAAMAAFSGSTHGGMSRRLESWCEEAAGRGDPSTAVVENVRAGIATPGFGHPLYPDGDPRAAFLLRLLGRLFAHEFRPWAELLRAAEAAEVEKPSFDLALALVSRTLNLPRGAAFHLFALGRMAGWVAHAAEQGDRGTPIRPRAVYRGEEPGT